MIVGDGEPGFIRLLQALEKGDPDPAIPGVGRFAGGLLERTRLAPTMLLERRGVWARLGSQPPDNRQLLLFNERAGQQ